MKNTRKWIAVFIAVLLIAVGMIQPVFAFLIHKSDSVVNVFLPEEYAVNDLTITKKVEHPFSGSYVIPDSISFDFEVDLGTYYAGKTLSTTAGDMTADDKGIIKLALKPGESVGITGIDEETEVTVTEIQNRPGFIPKDGENVKKVTISADAASAVEFVNVYTPDTVKASNVTVTGTKILEGREWQEGDTFEFLLEHENDKGEWVSLGTASVAYDDEDQTFNSFDFNEIIQSLEFDKEGNYKFRMSEIKGDLENVDYDENVNNFIITVADKDMDGKLEISEVNAWQNATATETDGKFDVSVVFNNTFKPLPVPEDILLPIAIEKTVTSLGETSIGPEDFEFVLKNIDTGNVMSTLSDESGKAQFDFTFTADDVGSTFVFELTETDDGREGVTYSDLVYDIRITIDLDEENQIVATVFCNEIETVNMIAEFENIYDDGTETEPPSDTTVTDTDEPPVTTDEPDKPAPPTGNGPNYIPYALMVAIGSILLIINLRKKRETV